MNTTSALLFYHVDSLIKNNDSTLARQTNNLIYPNNNFEYNQKIVNEIYNETWAKDIFVFTVDQFAILTAIANQNPIDGGPAVYAARIMADMELDDDYTESLSRIPNSTYDSLPKNKNTPFDNQLKVYPVPSSSLINISLGNEFDCPCSVKLLNNIGQTMISTYIYSENKTHELNIEKLSSGIYELIIQNDSNSMLHKKIVVFKK